MEWLQRLKNIDKGKEIAKKSNWKVFLVSVQGMLKCLLVFFFFCLFVCLLVYFLLLDSKAKLGFYIIENGTGIIHGTLEWKWGRVWKISPRFFLPDAFWPTGMLKGKTHGGAPNSLPITGNSLLWVLGSLSLSQNSVPTPPIKYVPFRRDDLLTLSWALGIQGPAFFLAIHEKHPIQV